MFADNCSNIKSSIPFQIRLGEISSVSEQDIIMAYLSLLPKDCVENIEPISASVRDSATVTIKSMVDGRGLACPMPLLKTKVALRDVAIGDSLYVIATDPNSRADIAAFCLQNQQANSAISLQLLVNQSTTDKTNQSSIEAAASASFDTIFHFIITKTDSN